MTTHYPSRRPGGLVEEASKLEACFLYVALFNKFATPPLSLQRDGSQPVSCSAASERDILPND